MPTFYVQPNGLDTNNGSAPGTSSPAGAWKTITYAMANCSATVANTIWIAPGTYRDPTVTLAKSGFDASNVIATKGDPNCTVAWEPMPAPGIVRWTNANADDLTQAGSLLDMGGRNYVEFYDLYFDGVSAANSGNNETIDGDAAQAHQKLFRCWIMGGYTGAARVHLNKCCVVAPTNGVYQCSSASGGGVVNCFVCAPLALVGSNVTQSFVINGGGSPQRLLFLTV